MITATRFNYDFHFCLANGDNLVFEFQKLLYNVMRRVAVNFSIT